jgi:hypothetical protein
MKVELNGFEMYLLTQGLNVVRQDMIEDIKKVESEGKTPLWTEGYVNMICDELAKKLEGKNN